MKKNFLFLAFLVLLLNCSFGQKGKFIIYGLRHGGIIAADSVCRVMKDDCVNFPEVENMAFGMISFVTSTDISDSDSLVVQKRLLIALKADTNSMRFKKYNEVKAKVVNFYEAFSLFPTDTSSISFTKRVGKNVTVDYKGLGNYLDGYTPELDSLIDEFFDLKKSLSDSNPELQYYVVERMLFVYQRVNAIREEEMIRVIKSKTDRGFIVGYPVGDFHRMGLKKLAEEHGIEVIVNSSFDPRTMDEGERFALEVTNFSQLPEKRRKEIATRFVQYWIEENKK